MSITVRLAALFLTVVDHCLVVFNGGFHFFLLELTRVFILDDIHASLTIAKGGVLGDFAAAKVHRFTWELLIDLEF